tara:strand:+ start:521 stop:712 length:192 start_codon:yes stop_codon:yes gene_type:complete
MYMVYWKKMMQDKTDAPMMSFDTSIEARAYIKGIIDAIKIHVEKTDELKLIQEFEVREHRTQK